MKQIDFLPKRIRAQRRVYIQFRRQLLTVLLFAGVLALLGHYNERRIAKAATDLLARQNEAAQMAADLKVLPDLVTQLADGQIKRRISRELGSRLTINVLLAELGRLLPPSAGLTSLECRTIDVMVPSRPPETPGKTGPTTRKRVRVTVTGVAPTAVDVADFIGRLSGSPLFTDVEMGYANTVVLQKENRRARSFKVAFLMAE